MDHIYNLSEFVGILFPKRRRGLAKGSRLRSIKLLLWAIITLPLTFPPIYLLTLNLRKRFLKLKMNKRLQNEAPEAVAMIQEDLEVHEHPEHPENPENHENNSHFFRTEKEKIEMMIANDGKFEFGLRSVFQLTLEILLLFNAYSLTQTNKGLDNVYIDNPTKVMTWIVFDTEIRFATRIWFFVCIFISTGKITWYFAKGIGASRSEVCLKAKICVGSSAILSIVSAVFANILYFSPSLGLFNLLRHIQCEQRRWDPILKVY